jgi:hypothetical protein
VAIWTAGGITTKSGEHTLANTNWMMKPYSYGRDFPVQKKMGHKERLARTILDLVMLTSIRRQRHWGYVRKWRIRGKKNNK